MTELRRADARFYSFMVIPGMALYMLIIVIPIVASILLGFTRFNIYTPAESVFIGLKNYARMLFQDQRISSEFWSAFRNNMIVVAVSVFGQIPLGFILAYILFRNRIRGTAFFQAMVFLPNFISTVVIGLLWKNLISPIGPMTALFRMLSGDPQKLILWQLDKSTAMIPVAIALLWIYTGFYMVVFLANMQRIDTEILEAAMIDGAGEIKIFTRIVFPLLIGVVFVNSILAIAGSLRGFDLIFAMTAEGVARENSMVLPIFMYKYAFRIPSNDAFSFGAAISNVIVVISCSLIIVAGFVRKIFSGEGTESI